MAKQAVKENIVVEIPFPFYIVCRECSNRERFPLKLEMYRAPEGLRINGLLPQALIENQGWEILEADEYLCPLHTKLKEEKK